MNRKEYLASIPTAKERFLERVKVYNGTIGCWVWPGNKTTAGYGVIRDNTKQKYAHRLSFEVFKGPIPAGMFVCHKCDNPPCVNPDHLFAGTNKDNIRDASSKMRLKRGLKLTDANVLDIIKMCSSGALQKDVAKIFSVGQQCISLIVTGKRFARLSNEALTKIRSPLAKVL